MEDSAQISHNSTNRSYEYNMEAVASKGKAESNILEYSSPNQNLFSKFENAGLNISMGNTVNEPPTIL